MSRSRRGGRGDAGNGFDEWGGYMGAKKAKLEQQFEADTVAAHTAGGIFKGISIFVNGYTDPPAEELKRIMMTHGGIFHHYHKPNVTNFIVASNLPDVKIKQLKSSEIYIKPDWVTDSVAAGRMLSYKNYLLVTAAAQKGQGKLNFKSVQKTVQATDPLPRKIPIIISSERHDGDVVRASHAPHSHHLEKSTNVSSECHDQGVEMASQTSDFSALETFINVSSERHNQDVVGTSSTLEALTELVTFDDNGRSLEPMETSPLTPGTLSRCGTSLDVATSECGRQRVTEAGTLKTGDEPGTSYTTSSVLSHSQVLEDPYIETFHRTPSETCGLKMTEALTLQTGDKPGTSSGVFGVPCFSSVFEYCSVLPPSKVLPQISESEKEGRGGMLEASSSSSVIDKEGANNTLRISKSFEAPPDPSTNRLSIPDPENSGIRTDGDGFQRHLRAGEENFLSEFYNRSRLHHISTMGSTFKKYVQELRENSKGDFPGLKELDDWHKASVMDEPSLGADLTRFDANKEKVIMHIDMDCFFVSVGLRNRPELIGQPVVVTHARADSKSVKHGDQNRSLEFEHYRKKKVERMRDGVGAVGEEEKEKLFERIADIDETASMSEIASCSYEARAKGIKNGMFLGQAIKLCPELKTISYDFEGYQEVALCLYNTVASYTLEIEAVSCDEMYVDIKDVLKKTDVQPLQFTAHLREVIKKKTSCTASTGLGPNMLLARMATKKAKPNGQYHLVAKEALTYMASQPVDSLPGVGRATAYRLKLRGIETCGDLQQASLLSLQHEFGAKTGETLYQHCRGVDNRKLDTEHVRKSISVAVNYGIRFVDDSESFKFVRELSDEVAKRMTEAHVAGRKITLQIMSRAKDAPVEAAKFMGHGVCDAFSKSVNLATATASAGVIEKECLHLLKQLKLPASELRGIGIHISRLDVSSKRTTQTAGNSVRHFFSKGPAIQRSSTSEPSSLQNANYSKSPVPHSHHEKIADQQPSEVGLSEGEGVQEEAEGEISLEFLNALPEEIKREIEEDLKAQRTRKRAASVVHEPQEKKNVAAVGGKDWQVTSFGQVDPEVLKELPEDLQREIRNQLNPPGPSNQAGSKTGIGRSPRKPPAKKKATPKKGKGKKKTPFLPMGKLKHMFQDLKKQQEAPVVSEENNNSTPSTNPEPVQPNLAGAVSLMDVKAFLKEWLESGEYPESDDVTTVTQYFCDLIYHKNLYLLDLLIKYLLRLLKSGEFESWRACVRGMVESVQAVMIEQHNHKLKVDVF